MKYTVTVDHGCYGLFATFDDAFDWLKKNWPVAFGQGRYFVCPFVDVVTKKK